MKVTDLTRGALAVRRQYRDLTKKGYKRIWDPLYLGYDKKITKVVIGANGRDLFVLVKERKKK